LLVLPAARILFLVACWLLTVCFLVAASGSTARKYNKKMQNEPNFTNSSVYASNCTVDGYDTFGLTSQQKNEPKQTQNEPKQTQNEPNFGLK
jgi:hypothetical protein